MTGGTAGASGVTCGAPGALGVGAVTGVAAGFLQETKANVVATGSDRSNVDFMNAGWEFGGKVAEGR